jgi:hypothetical protein
MPRAAPRRARCLVGALGTLGALALATPSAGAQQADSTHAASQPLFTRRDAVVAGSFALATVALFPLDERIARELQEPDAQGNRFLHHVATDVELITSPGAMIIGGTLYVVGRVGRFARVADLGLHGTEAIAVGSGLTTVLKVAFGRARPNVQPRDPHNFKFGRGLHDDRYRSFPSGHSVAGFAAAATVTEETRRWWPGSQWYVGTVMYGGAALIGASRMYNNRHWASDVVMGAAIGSFAGRKVVRYQHSHPGNDLDRILLGATVLPSPGGGSVIVLTIAPR